MARCVGCGSTISGLGELTAGSCECGAAPLCDNCTLCQECKELPLDDLFEWIDDEEEEEPGAYDALLEGEL